MHKPNTPPLLQMLLQHQKNGPLAMHMPGHKRNTQFAPYLETLGAGLDITEIDGFDDLHHPEDILRQSMERAAKLWGARHSFYLVNGSTGGILAAMRAMTASGDRVLLTRGCHRSVYHGLELMDLQPVYLAPMLDETFGIMASITPFQLERAFAEHPGIKLVILTSPTYEGVVSDLTTLCQIAHRHGALVLVDEAHGAHLALSDSWPTSAVQAGADVVVQSLHKTLPSLTQTAILHLASDRVNPSTMMQQLAIFQTSSPSYLFLASMDGCVDYLEQYAPQAMEKWWKSLESFERAIQNLSHLQVLGYGKDKLSGHPLLYQIDPSKLVISCRNCAITGPELAQLLRQDYGIQLEMACATYVLAMTGLAEPQEHLGKLAKALLDIDRKLGNAPVQTTPLPVEIPRRRCSISAALRQYAYPLVPQDAIGKISAEYVWAYPPGIPLIVPGEQIDARFLVRCQEMTQSGISLRSTRGNFPHTIQCCDPPQSK